MNYLEFDINNSPPAYCRPGQTIQINILANWDNMSQDPRDCAPSKVFAYLYEPNSGVTSGTKQLYSSSPYPDNSPKLYTYLYFDLPNTEGTFEIRANAEYSDGSIWGPICSRTVVLMQGA